MLRRPLSPVIFQGVGKCEALFFNGIGFQGQYKALCEYMLLSLSRNGRSTKCTSQMCFHNSQIMRILSAWSPSPTGIRFAPSEKKTTHRLLHKVTQSEKGLVREIAPCVAFPSERPPTENFEDLYKKVKRSEMLRLSSLSLPTLKMPTSTPM